MSTRPGRPRRAGCIISWYRESGGITWGLKCVSSSHFCLLLQFPHHFRPRLTRPRRERLRSLIPWPLRIKRPLHSCAMRGIHWGSSRRPPRRRSAGNLLIGRNEAGGHARPLVFVWTHPWAFADELPFSYVLAIRSQVSAMCKSMTRWEAFLSVWAKHRHSSALTRQDSALSRFDGSPDIDPHSRRPPARLMARLGAWFLRAVKNRGLRVAPVL